MMGSLVPWRTRYPAVFSRLEQEMDDLMGRFWGMDELPVWEKETAFSPSLNLAESEKGYEVTVDLPGIEPKDLTVEIRNGVLSIRGEKSEEHEEKGKTFHRVERRYGKFHRSIPLELPVQEEKIEAKYHDGVLQITVPKAPGAEVKRIKIGT